MKRAINGLPVQPTHLLIDAMTLETDINQTSLVKGDAKVYQLLQQVSS